MPQAINISRYEAEQIRQLQDNIAFISIWDKEAGPLKAPENCADFLSITFADLPGASSITHKGILYEAATHEDIHAILNFCHKNKNNNILIHCTAGVSRSSAVSLLCHIVFGHTLKPHFWQTSSPNCYILGYLLREYYQHFDWLEKLNFKEDIDKTFLC